MPSTLPRSLKIPAMAFTAPLMFHAGSRLPSGPYELVKTLREFSETARSLRILANYLERHPNALVFGRQESGAK